MSTPPNFAPPSVSAVLASSLGLAGELLLQAARQRRLEEAVIRASAEVRARPPQLGAPLSPAETDWVAQRADEMVEAWLAPLTGARRAA